MFLTLAAILGALAAGVVSPGPSFVMVSRTAVAESRMNGLLAALGLAFGGMLYAILALAGLQALFNAVPVAYVALKVLGGLYLVYLGYRIWKGASAPLMLEAGAQSGSRSFALGLATQLSNPKTAIVYASVFAAFLPNDPNLALTLLIPLLCFLTEATWYVFVAFALSAPRARVVYLRARGVVDRLAATMLTFLGARFVATAFR